MADLDEWKTLWQSERGISEERFEQIGAKIKNSSRLLQSTIFRRDMGETMASIIVIFFFSLFLSQAKNWIEWSGSAIIVMSGITIPLTLWWARRRSIDAVSAANFRDFVTIEIDYLRRQILLLRMVGWWFLLPMFVGMTLMMIGVVGLRRDGLSVVPIIAIAAFAAAFFLYIWRLNQTACKKHFEPLLQYYVDMEAALAGDPMRLDLLSDPPSEFLKPAPAKPISRRRRWLGIALTVLATLLVLGGGIATMENFDARTGKFVISCAPVVAVLVSVITGIWRRGSQSQPSG